MKIDHETGMLVYNKVLLATKLKPQQLAIMMGYADKQMLAGLINNYNKKKGSFPLPLWRVLNVLIHIYKIDIDTPKYDPIIKGYQSYTKKTIRIYLDGRFITRITTDSIESAKKEMDERYKDTPFIEADDFEYVE